MAFSSLFWEAQKRHYLWNPHCHLLSVEQILTISSKIGLRWPILVSTATQEIWMTRRRRADWGEPLNGSLKVHVNASSMLYTFTVLLSKSYTTIARMAGRRRQAIVNQARMAVKKPAENSFWNGSSGFEEGLVAGVLYLTYPADVIWNN